MGHRTTKTGSLGVSPCYPPVVQPYRDSRVSALGQFRASLCAPMCCLRAPCLSFRSPVRQAPESHTPLRDLLPPPAKRETPHRRPDHGPTCTSVAVIRARFVALVLRSQIASELTAQQTPHGSSHDCAMNRRRSPDRKAPYSASVPSAWTSLQRHLPISMCRSTNLLFTHHSDSISDDSSPASAITASSSI